MNASQPRRATTARPPSSPPRHKRTPHVAYEDSAAPSAHARGEGPKARSSSEEPASTPRPARGEPADPAHRTCPREGTHRAPRVGRPDAAAVGPRAACRRAGKRSRHPRRGAVGRRRAVTGGDRGSGYVGARTREWQWGSGVPEIPSKALLAGLTAWRPHAGRAARGRPLRSVSSRGSLSTLPGAPIAESARARSGLRQHKGAVPIGRFCARRAAGSWCGPGCGGDSSRPSAANPYGAT